MTTCMYRARAVLMFARRKTEAGGVVTGTWVFIFCLGPALPARQTRPAPRTAQSAASLYEHAKASYFLDNFDRSIEVCDQLIARNSHDAGAYCLRALACNGKKDYDGAIAECNKAIALDPRMAGAYYARGMARYSKGECERAVDDYSVAILLDPAFIGAFFSRSISFGGNGH